MSRLFDDSLYEGSAEHYLAGRLPYPQRLATVLSERLGLDSKGRLLDLGCGPGSLTLLLAPLFAGVVAVDADVDMVRVGRAEALRHGLTNIEWRHECAEDLAEDVGPFDVVTLAQSFHWMDRPVVAARIRRWLAPDGWCVHVGATTHAGDPDAVALPHPPPPRDRIDALVHGYLGPERRAGRQIVTRETPGGESAVFRHAGFLGPEIVPVPGGDVFVRTVDQVVAAVLSLSSSAPHLFGDRLAEFVAELRALLLAASPEGLFGEQLQGMRLFLWSSGK